ncbi:tail fiber assembly protein [Erwinia billingiae]|uniref:tail fiber assembly protein n=1 Tax=Erwinia billingiae TaxID=182337 RepID=UPI00069E8481|nr:tail assembly chaperone [Erwinia billingiae]
MSKYYYSATTNSFYAAGLYEDYVTAESWPADAREVSDQVFSTFSAPSVNGMVRSCNADGEPCWIEPPALTQAEEVAEAEVKRNALLSHAQEIILNWQSELTLGIISDEDKDSLILWLNYIKQIQALDTSHAPDIIWPDVPAVSN